jgi:SAM-dependent methyltransferase
MPFPSEAPDVPCPLCRAPARRRFEVRGYPVHACRACDHHFTWPADPATHVARTYGDAYFTGGGAGYTDYLAEEPIIRAHGRRYARLLARYGTPGRLLDVGSAAGFLLRGFVEQGWTGEGVEPNAWMAAQARASGLDVHTATFEETAPREPFDLVVMVQVIAHMLAPLLAFRHARAMLRRGGLLLVETWDRRSLTARLFGRHWHEYSPPSVLHWFSRPGLRTLADRAGLALVAQGVPGKWIGGAHAKALLEHAGAGTRVGRLAAKVGSLLPDRARLPYPAEDLFWMLFRAA